MLATVVVSVVGVLATVVVSVVGVLATVVVSVVGVLAIVVVGVLAVVVVGVLAVAIGVDEADELLMAVVTLFKSFKNAVGLAPLVCMSLSNFVAALAVLKSLLFVKLLKANVTAVEPDKPPCCNPFAIATKLAAVLASAAKPVDPLPRTLAAAVRAATVFPFVAASSPAITFLVVLIVGVFAESQFVVSP